MEIIKHQKVAVQIVKKIFFLFFFSIIISCNSIKTINNDHYKTEVFKSKNSSSYITLQAFHYENKNEKSLSTYRINNLIFSEHNLNSLILHVLPNKFKIEAGLFGKEWIRLKNFNVKKRDSIVVSFFLEDIKELLINNEGTIIK